MHDLLLAHQGDLLMRDLVRYAGDIGLDTTRFRDYLARRAGAARVAEDVESADLSGVSGTPTFFVNGLRHHGAYDINALSEAVQTAKARAAIQKKPPAATGKSVANGR
jgi:predicted DsbA family dithiol-disulfide isomerase